ncbi:hypothetical protein [Roseimaritima ulvae]|uniref:Uncharacterized protein n=1 Tax=Roseimaritima ulvae TaxID=980254 RepID=A0A5B9QWS2_9BACT|nr:hypothetical protein [Roseimaritima ulvae]QEG43494.1 hypothetical protein UC8_55440 [Roseimaritima ulvae]
MFKVGLGMGAVLIALTLTGCGSKTPVASNDSSGPAAAPAATQAAGQAPQNGPTAVVSEFLDRVRRGGAAQVEAARLLTTRAQAECQRTGLQMDSVGSPDARYEVTRSEPVPDVPGAALVHSLWIEPSEEGGETSFQVVWYTQQEADAWRISGLVMELEPGTDPIMIDFENGDQAAAMLGLTAPADSGTAQAAAPAETTQR